MHTTYAAYRTALDAGHMAEAMALEARYYRMQERAQRWQTIGYTALWAACLALPIHVLTQLLP